MSEPPEPEQEEPAADADLEELLEQFREPEEPPRKRANPLWIVSAMLLSVLGVWLALRASGGGTEDEPKSTALAGAMLPGKTSERLPRGEETVDVVEDYLARCKKGMTAQEVRWIVEDFQRAGLGDGPGSLLAKMAETMEPPYSPSRSDELKGRLNKLVRDLGVRQRFWYAEALSNALRLDERQRSQVSEQLRLLLAEDLFLAQDEGNIGIESYLEAEGLRAHWLYDDAYAPWKLCDLSPEQESVTRRSEVEQEEDQQADGPEKDVTWTSTWADRETPFRSSLAETREIHLADGEFGELATAGGIFPLEEAQLFEGEKFLRINDPTRLHPAQLKMLLLLEPGKAAGILQALDKLGE